MDYMYNDEEVVHKGIMVHVYVYVCGCMHILSS